MTQSTLERLTSLRLHQRDGRRAPHKPLLILLVLGELARCGSSELQWAQTADRLSDLIADFGPVSRTGRTQSAAYPFTRLRSDGIWTLSRDVPMDLVGPLTRHRVHGRLDAGLEAELRRSPDLLRQVARTLVEKHFPPTIAPDVLLAVGLDPDSVLQSQVPTQTSTQRRSARWSAEILLAWDRQCAFCGYDGQLGRATVGVEAAHVRWWAFDGPNSSDNGLALCVLHHKLFDFGALGLDDDLRITVSTFFTSRTVAGRRVYDLHGRRLRPRPGTPVPAPAHIVWHRREVFKGGSLAILPS
ncbi:MULTISPECIES: phosphorothioated DNA-binding restriction endonuclease [Micromonospora]|uniref:phosphorothioated DNA-binding restriction endonuclease n=1 Tax=Micromonospora TaxID=1873 RepID=UPI000DE8500F|nr:restriction endonuclease [Micromonospora sp. LHW51205]